MAQKARKPGSPTPDDPCPALLLENQVCFALYTASRLLTQAYQPRLEPLGLTYPQYLALLVLWERDGLTVSELGGRLSLDSGTLSPLLKKLEARGWISRERKPEDERSVVLRLTPQGRELKRKAMPVPEEMACLTEMSGTRLAKLRQELEALSASLRGALGAGPKA